MRKKQFRTCKAAFLQVLKKIMDAAFCGISPDSIKRIGGMLVLASVLWGTLRAPGTADAKTWTVPYFTAGSGEDIPLIKLDKKSVKQFPGITYEYNDSVKHVKIVNQNHVVTFFLGEKTFYADGRRKTFPVAPAREYIKKEHGYRIIVPFIPLFEGLGMTAERAEGGGILLGYTKQKTGGVRLDTQYAYTKNEYVRREYVRAPKVSKNKYRKLLTPSNDRTGKFQFLRVDSYRDVDKEYFCAYCQYLIADFCRQKNIPAKKSVLYNKATAILRTAKKYDIDPVYFACQTFHESAFGTSALARGTRLGKKKYYNLYGIKAVDWNPRKRGAAYAKKRGWDTVGKALSGAAQYLVNKYIYAGYGQDTVFKIRFAPGKAIWHQYATDPYYAEQIGERMYQMSFVYTEPYSYFFDFPVYR